MQEERLTVLSLIQNDCISAVDGKRLLEVLAAEEDKVSAPGFRELRLHVLQWLGRRQINSSQAIELMLMINAIAQDQKQESAEILQELKIALQLKDANSVEARTVIQIVNMLKTLFSHDLAGTRHMERLEILSLVQNRKITGTTALEFLQALLPEKPKSPEIPASPREQRNPTAPKAILPQDFATQLGRSIREEIRRVIPEQTSRSAKSNPGMPNATTRETDLRTAIKREVQQALEASRKPSRQTAKTPTEQNTTTPVAPVTPAASIGTSPATAQTIPAKKSLLDPLMDRLHDNLRELEFSSRAVEQNWAALNQTPAPAHFESLLQRMRASLGNIHQKLAQVSEARTALELHLNTVEEDERRFALELLDHAQNHYRKHTERLKELEAGVAELSTFSHMQHEDELQNLHSKGINPDAKDF